jgi:exopolysaccharide biosynthesis polyprenyl glycosylphosphotransferase
VVDLLAVFVPWMVVLAVLPLTDTYTRSPLRSLALALVGTISTVMLFQRRGIYDDRPGLPRVEVTSRTISSVLIGATVLALFAAIADIHLGAREVVLFLPLVLLMLAVARGYIRAWLDRPAARQRIVERVVVVGVGEEARELVELIGEHPDSNLQVLGVVGDPAVAERHGLRSLWLGPVDRLVELLFLHQGESAVVTPTGFRSRQFRSTTRELLQAGYEVRISTGITRLYSGRLNVSSLVHEPLISIECQRVPAFQLRAKRVADVVLASIALVLAAPVMALTALAIKIEDGGPVLFRQTRTGAQGRTFAMTKFRSMVQDAESRKADLAEHNERSGPLFKLTSDPRVTRVGRFIRETSIDELPQLFNVLTGDMSLVGPRPALPEEVAEFDTELRSRSLVPPGITGLWQVEARSNASFNAYRRLDLHYVENWSVAMDLRILLTTAEQVLVALATSPLRLLTRWATRNGVATSPAAGGDGVVIELRDRDRSAVLTGTTARASAATPRAD